MAREVHGGGLIEKLKAYLPAGSRLLEIGSGPGTDWNILRQHYHVVGSDNSLEFLNHLKSTYPEGHFMSLDAVTLKVNATFDAIYSNKVMHHLSDQDLAVSIVQQQEILVPGGIICHSFWKGKGSEVFKGMFVNYHSEQSLKATFGPQFDLLLVEPYQEFEPDDSLLMVGRKK